MIIYNIANVIVVGVIVTAHGIRIEGRHREEADRLGGARYRIETCNVHMYVCMYVCMCVYVC